MNRTRQYPLYVHVSTLFLLLISGVTALLIGLGYFSSLNLIESVAEDLTLRISRETSSELQRTLQPVNTAVNVLAFDALAQAPALPQRLQRIGTLQSLLDHTEALSSVYVGYANGDFFLMRRIKGGEEERLRLKAPVGTVYVVQSIERRYKPARGVYLYLDGSTAEIKRVVRPDYPIGYDPRQRGWYTQARSSGHAVLTAPYLFFSDRQVGITMATPARVARDTVVGADIQLATLSKSLSYQKVTPHSQLAITDPKGALVAHEDVFALGHTVTDDGQPRLASLENFGVPILASVAQNVDLRTALQQEWTRQVLVSEGEHWQVAITRLASEGVSDLLLVIAIPHHELLAAVYQQARVVGLAAAIIVLVSIPLTWWLARGISRPLMVLTRATEAIRHFRFDEPLVMRSYILEVNQLGQTIQKMKSTIQRFLELSETIASAQNFDRLLPRLLRETVHATDSYGGVLYIHGSAGLLPVCAIASDERSREQSELATLHGVRRALSYPMDAAALARECGPLMAKALAGGRLVAGAVTEADRAALGLAALPEFGAPLQAVAVPLLNRQRELSGAMLLLCDQPAGQDLLSFIDALSGTAAVSLEAQALIKEQKALFEAFIQLIADAIDTKSAYTGGHCARVPELARLLAQAACDADKGRFESFSLDDDEWETLRVAAWLHDCGKVTTPEYVVDKGTKLETLYNRIHEVRMRFEVLKRDAEIQHWRRVLAGEPATESEQTMWKEWRQLDADFALVARCNVGGETLSERDRGELARIAQRSWQRTLDNRLGLSHDELARLRAAEPSVPALPVLEQVLSDRPEHRFYRGERDRMPPDNRWGFRMTVPELLYNQGELYNLCVGRGTLTDEERYKINEHIVQTEVMLRELPFPRHLQRVPDIAAAHHEKLDGTGYPKRLDASQLSTEARILAIADIFEALTASDRPYKKGMKLSEALAIMADMRARSHIDGDLFELFLTSGVYRRYAERFMRPDQIDEVDVAAVLGHDTPTG